MKQDQELDESVRKPGTENSRSPEDGSGETSPVELKHGVTCVRVAGSGPQW